MKEDRMLTDIELKDVAAGTGDAEEHAYRILPIVYSQLYDLWEKLRPTYSDASEIRKMAECCEAIMNDYSMKSKKIKDMKWYCNIALNSNIPTPFALVAQDLMNSLIKEIGE